MNTLGMKLSFIALRILHDDQAMIESFPLKKLESGAYWGLSLEGDLYRFSFSRPDMSIMGLLQAGGQDSLYFTMVPGMVLVFTLESRFANLVHDFLMFEFGVETELVTFTKKQVQELDKVQGIKRIKIPNDNGDLLDSETLFSFFPTPENRFKTFELFAKTGLVDVPYGYTLEDIKLLYQKVQHLFE